MPPPIDPFSKPRYVLKGRVVTMGPLGVLDDGAIYVDGDTIVAVQAARDRAPEGFGGAPRVNGGDTIYPGLIELHNHLSYNAMPLWDVPQRFTNNNQWKGHADYRVKITKPSQVLGRTSGVAEAVVRFAEARCLLGGCTTSQGITLSSAPGLRSYYRGVVRNVEQPLEEGLPRAGTKIANPATGKAAEYLASLQRKSCYLQHLSEGVDRTARGWFQRLQLEDGRWAITDALCGIHSTALNQEDFEIVAEHGGSAVWSPLSNYLLYGRTLDPNLPKDAGVLLAIGCDWSPSGSKNLLGELKVAWLANLQAGSPYTARDFVEMATINAARILKWDHALGSIEPGKRADLIAINGKSGDDFLRLIEARETAVTLVVIDGIPRVGQPGLMKRFGGGTERVRVGRSTRVLNLAQPDTHPLVRDLTLSEATDRLADAMERLPELADRLDRQVARGGPLAGLGGSRGADGNTWRIVMDVDEDDGLDETALAALPLASFVEPMTLPGISVADDDDFLEELVRARNLPEFVKKSLPPMYGKRIALPDSAEFLERSPQRLPVEVRETTGELRSFLRTWGELSREEQRLIVDQALVVIEECYVHLPLKRAMHAVEPVQRLKLLRHRLEDERAELAPEIEFHDEMASIFNSLRDLHTVYRLPFPFRNKTAWLPFLIEEYWQAGTPRYLVSKVVGEAGPQAFEPGVEVTHWNGMPIGRAVARNADRHAGSNEAARHARGLHSLSIRPLSHGRPPDEESVTLRFVDLGGKERTWTQQWLVFEPQRASGGLDPESLLREATVVGVDPQTDDVQHARKALFAGDLAARERRAGALGFTRAVKNTSGGIPTFLPTVFRPKIVATDHGEFGYLRIFTFSVSDDERFVDEFARLLEEMPERGLILDVRGNAGGLIPAAERILQLLTPLRIQPERAQFINTPLNLQLCRAHAPSPLFSDFSLAPWIDSIEQSVRTGATFSLGHPITSEAACNDIGQRYYGPVLLVIDGLCYSSTDIFAAGFQDHEIGTILGVDANTGAGGANVWSHHLLQRLAAETEETAEAFTPLPHGADLRVAVRRMVRVRENAGVVVEDLGIEPEHRHQMTRNDLMKGNVDLINEAGRLLSEQVVHSMRVALSPKRGVPEEARVTTRRVDRVDLRVDDRPVGSFDVKGRSIVLPLAKALASASGARVPVEIDAYFQGELVAGFREHVDRS